jgi:hypothetical protein
VSLSFFLTPPQTDVDMPINWGSIDSRLLRRFPPRVQAGANSKETVSEGI